VSENVSPPIVCEALGSNVLAGLDALFERVGSGCYCRYFQFEGDKNDWQARLAFAPEDNRRELHERAHAPGLAGMVARASELVIGWMKLERASTLAKLYAQRPYRALPDLTHDRAGVFTVGCFLIDPAWRRRGVASALLRRGIEAARAEGARAIEAFPRRAEGVSDEQLFSGPLALYLKHGFVVAHEQSQYPVLRLSL
jgi:GNAT superfamily N-acetyltransferase